LTFLARRSINIELARQQHLGYCQVLEANGFDVVVSDANAHLPDSVFVEDMAVVLNDRAVAGRAGIESRRAEAGAITSLLGQYRSLESIKAPGTLEGGDVLRIGNSLLVGRSVRTNEEAIRQLQQVLQNELEIVEVPVTGCLHLKTACCAVDDSTLLVNPDWIDTAGLRQWKLLPVAANEPFAANLLRLPKAIYHSASHPVTTEMLRGRGYAVETVDISELEKAEAGLTCLSLLIA